MNAHIVKLFAPPGSGMALVFDVTKFCWELPQRGVKYTQYNITKSY